jgi:hypothetical protein
MALEGRLKFFAFAVLVIVTGCAVPRAGIIMPDGSTVYTLHPRLEFVDTQGRPVPSVQNTRKILVIFAVIPGEIYGEVRGGPVQVIRADMNHPFPLDLGDMVADIRRKAESLQTDFGATGLVVAPPNTRFARIATMAADEETQMVFGAGFLDSASRDGLILVYVDRACTITGTQHMMGDDRRFDVTLRAPGFHWIRVAGVGTKSLHLTDSDGPQDVIYTISPTQ